MKKNIISWIAQIVVVIILGQTLFFKFTDAPETVELFAQLGMGAFGYKLIGSLELIACVLLLIRPSIIWGAILSWGLMSGAIMAHVTKVGFEGELGILGGMAITAWLLSCLIIFLRRNQVSFIANMFGSNNSNELHN
ncbi:MAG: putative oxidoreductase [Candidatus Azotimanducaceae bacterium]|jgi:putative oxidoreductase